MMKKLRSLVAIVCILSMLSSGVGVFAAGYDVIREPWIDYIDGIINQTYEDASYELATYFFPTPFNKGFSVVHNDVRIMPGYEATYFDKSSYVVDLYGNKIDVGTYDCLGVYPFDFDQNPSYYFDGYNNPAFNPREGVDFLGHITVSKNGKGGLIDTQGNIIIPCEYDDLYDGAYEEYGVYDGLEADDWPTDIKPYSGKYFEPYYDPYYFYEYDHDYNNGLAVVAESRDENSKVGIVDTNDNIIVPFIYDMITPCYDKTCWVLKDGKWGIITVDNQIVSVKVDNQDVEFDQIPLIINGRTLAPLRAIFEALDATVEWDDNTKTIIATRGDTTVTMTIGKGEMYKNGNMIWLDEAPQIISERTLVPVRAIAESFDCKVDWDGETQTVSITK